MLWLIAGLIWVACGVGMWWLAVRYYGDIDQYDVIILHFCILMGGLSVIVC